MKLIWGTAVMAMAASTALAQSDGTAIYSAAKLHRMAQKLEQQKSFDATGSAGETLEKYPGHFTMLTVRDTSGGAEVHEHYSDIFFVVEGDATLTTGGTVVDPKSVGPGETRGTRVEGGTRQNLGKGTVVHISANTPHQLTIAKGHSFTYFVVKVKE